MPFSPSLPAERPRAVRVGPLLLVVCTAASASPTTRPLLAQSAPARGGVVEPNAGTVRGIVRDSASGRPLAGAAVLLRDSLDQTVGRAVTDERGRYVLAPRAAGRRLRVLHLGFRPADLPLAAGGAGREVALAAVPPLLAPVQVATSARCPKETNTPAALGLLGQVRAGLLATAIAGAQQPRALTVLNFVREYQADDPPDAAGAEDPTQIVRQTVRLQTSGSVVAPFGASRTGAEFVRDGFTADSAGQTKYFAPDPEVLVDDAFAAGYCFRVLKSEQREVVGVGFSAARRREGRVDVDGVLWVDTLARSLRELRFRYVGFTPHVTELRPGGVVSFREMPTGVAYIDRWTLRLVSGREVTDENAARRLAGGSSTYGDPGFMVREPAPLLSVRDVGGELAQVTWPDGRAWRAPLGAWRLQLTDQHGRPAAGAEVRLVGTEYAGTADTAGAVVFSDLLPGPYAAQAGDPLLERLGKGRRADVRAVVVRDSTVVTRLATEMAERVVAVRSLPPDPRAPSTTSGKTSTARNDGKSVESMITGRFAGVEAVRGEDGALRFRIRGTVSSSGSGTEPLVVVDEVQLPLGPINLDFLNPEDIERIEVLKNAEDVALYGRRGMNGVIRITTRRPPPPQRPSSHPLARER